uniref:Uncharacterized protein n=1 Tax=Eutreptiella gymnastica TaxID=73025 RepID=A0A7S4FST8_9EUGL
MVMCGCGIRGLEMLGTEQDWAVLGQKLQVLRSLLAPIEGCLRLKPFFDTAAEVFANLHRTYVDGAAMRKWWADVLLKSSAYEYGPSGMRRHEVEAYNGWLVQFLAGTEKIKANDLRAGRYAEQLSTLSACPMKVVDAINKVSDNATLIAGVLGYTVHGTANDAVTLRPAHGWCMMLPPESPLRRSHAEGRSDGCAGPATSGAGEGAATEGA